MKWIAFISKIAVIGLFYAFCATFFEYFSGDEIPLWFTALAGAATILSLYDEWPFSVVASDDPETGETQE